LCGVDGVNVDGIEDAGPLLGGVCDRGPSRAPAPRVAEPNSGDRLKDPAWGTEFSKSSARSKVEKVRLASSAASLVRSWGLSSGSRVDT
jgi:hypothetical protein